MSAKRKLASRTKNDHLLPDQHHARSTTQSTGAEIIIFLSNTASIIWLNRLSERKRQIVCAITSNREKRPNKNSCFVHCLCTIMFNGVCVCDRQHFLKFFWTTSLQYFEFYRHYEMGGNMKKKTSSKCDMGFLPTWCC